MSHLWGSLFIGDDAITVELDEESDRTPYRVRFGTLAVHLDGQQVRDLSAAIDAAVIAHDAKVWEPYYVDHDAQYARIGRSHEPPFDVAKALDAEAARQEADDEPWNDREWHWMQAAAIAPGDVVWFTDTDDGLDGYWSQVTYKSPGKKTITWGMADGSTYRVDRSKAFRLADKVRPDSCGGGDLPEPGRSFDVV